MKDIVKLYMRKRCHLCEIAKEILDDMSDMYDFEVIEVDIDQDDCLIEKYGISIPVIELNGEEVQAGIIEKNVIVKAFAEKNVKFIG